MKNFKIYFLINLIYTKDIFKIAKSKSKIKNQFSGLKI